ncbi:MAG TPA: PAS domain-containing protein [Stellaceae bacterium]|nr:PAS domain-containing protein [Stellaceae bacterium]
MNLLPHIRDERLQQAYLYWQRRRGERLAPRRSDLDPTDIPNLLPHLMLVDVFPGARQLRYRLVGTEVERNFGVSMTGRYIDEVMRGRYLEFVRGMYQQVIERCIPIYSENTFSDPDSRAFLQGWPLRTARVMLPLSSDGAAVDMVLIAQVFYRDATAAMRTVLATQDHFSIAEEATVVHSEAPARSSTISG